MENTLLFSTHRKIIDEKADLFISRAKLLKVVVKAVEGMKKVIWN